MVNFVVGKHILLACFFYAMMVNINFEVKLCSLEVFNMHKMNAFWLQHALAAHKIHHEACSLGTLFFSKKFFCMKNLSTNSHFSERTNMIEWLNMNQRTKQKHILLFGTEYRQKRTNEHYLLMQSYNYVIIAKICEHRTFYTEYFTWKTWCYWL